MAIQGNLNDTVWVELTEQGREFYAEWREKYRDRFPGMPEDMVASPLEEAPQLGPNFVSCPLFVLMHIFGSFIGFTARADMTPFKGNTIYYSRP